MSLLLSMMLLLWTLHFQCSSFLQLKLFSNLSFDIIATKYNGGPVGIETLATALGEDVKTIEDVYEPYLVQKGFIQRTPRGRKLTPYACKCFNLKSLDNFQQSFEF